MNTKLSLAVAAAVLATTPALAQVTSKSLDTSRYENNTPSGLPALSPQVQSLPGYNDEWSRNDSWDRPADFRDGLAGTSGATGGIVATTPSATVPSAGYPSYGVTGSGPIASNPYGSAERSGAISGTTGTAYSAPGTSYSGTSYSGSTTYGTPSVATTTDGRVAYDSSLDRPESRAGKGQNHLELTQTTLLNQLSAAGFAKVREFRKQGDGYVAMAQSKDGTWQNVQVDPQTGAITVLR